MVYPTEPRKPHTSAFFVFHWSIHTCSLAVSQTDRPKLTPSRRVSGQADRQTPLLARADKFLPPGLWSPPRSTVTVARCRVPAESKPQWLPHCQ